MKKNIHNLRVLSVLLVITTHLCAVDFEMDDLDVFADAMEWQATTRQGDDVTAQIVLDFIASPPLLLQNRLQNNLYLFTHPINKRSLLDYPFNVLHDYCLPDCGVQYNWWTFYNQTTVDNFTKEGTNITSYWNLDDMNIIGDLDQFDFGISIPRAAQLFGLLKIQERRTGFMFGAFASKYGWNIEAKMPLYYNERNFFVTEEEKRLIEQSIVFDDDDSGATDNEELRKHFVADAIGIGDSRVSAGCFIIDGERFKLNTGFEMTFPTAIAYQEGLLGSRFFKNSANPPFDLLQLFQLFLSDPPQIETVTEITIDFIAAAFDKLSANLLQTSLGNGGHIGAAAFFESFLPLNRRFKITTRGAIEYLFPTNEKRFYITKKFSEEFTSREPYTGMGADPDQAPEKLAFLNEQLIDTFFPEVFATSIYPGFLVKFSSELSGYFGDTWRFGIGYDLWWQDREKLGRIKANSLQIANIRTDIGIRSGAFQNKFFGTVNYYTEGRWFDWCLTFYSDFTVLRYGIGKDFTLSIRFSADM